MKWPLTCNLKVKMQAFRESCYCVLTDGNSANKHSGSAVGSSVYSQSSAVP